jgi:hypothetical protein
MCCEGEIFLSMVVIAEEAMAMPKGECARLSRAVSSSERRLSCWLVRDVIRIRMRDRRPDGNDALID